MVAKSKTWLKITRTVAALYEAIFREMNLTRLVKESYDNRSLIENNAFHSNTPWPWKDLYRLKC